MNIIIVVVIVVVVEIVLVLSEGKARTVLVIVIEMASKRNRNRNRNRNRKDQSQMQFDHEKLDVYRLAVEFAAWANELSKKLSGQDRHARDQLLRASQSIPLNIAEGNGKRSLPDRRRFFEIARGSSFECCAVLDVLFACKVIEGNEVEQGKKQLHRIVSMLSRMTETKKYHAADEVIDYEQTSDYDYDHAEYEHDKGSCSVRREPNGARARNRNRKDSELDSDSGGEIEENSDYDYEHRCAEHEHD